MIKNGNDELKCTNVKKYSMVVLSIYTLMSFTVIGLFSLFQFTISLELLELHVPSHVPVGARAALSCRWQLSPADVLYSVKWYKDGKEFFRHLPRDLEPKKFLLPGVDVEEFNSTGSEIVLMPAVLETGGRYRCEVSAEGPLFPTVSEHADLSIIVLPDQGPVLSGLESQYRVGDRLRASCTSSPSRPATQLAWYINGEPIPSEPPTFWTHDGLVTTSLLLDFPIKMMHLNHNLLKVKCVATIASFYWRTLEYSALLDSSRTSEKTETKRNRITRTDVIPTNCASSLVYTATILICLVIVVF